MKPLAPDDFADHLKPRPKESHKKDFGHVLVVAGSKEMPGAGYLASLAVLRSGGGLVTYCLPNDAFKKFESQYPEVMAAPADFSKPESVLKLCDKKEALVLGPGLGRAPETFALVGHLLENVSLPVVLDADGLMAIAAAPKILKKRKGPTILTPHPGEMAALIGGTTEQVQKNRELTAKEAADLWKVVVVLKGFQSLVALPDGRVYVNPTGNPGMATAGMGDVLAGMIGGLLAQGFPLDKAALAGVYLHGLAGDMAAEEMGQKGLIASDLLGYVPKAIREVEQTR